MSDDRIGRIRGLLLEAEKAHATYEATELNGVYDEQWPQWYAAYAVEHGMGELTGHDLTPDALAALLAGGYADFERGDAGPDEGWADYVARRIAAEG